MIEDNTKKSGAGGNPTTATTREQDKVNPPNGLNYILLIKNFWRVNLEHDFKPSERSVFFYLAEACNSLSWRNPFNHSRRQITQGANISPSVYKNVLAKLEAAGLIEVTPGRPGYRKNDAIVTNIRIIEPPVFVSMDGNRVENVPVKNNRVENVPVNDNRVENVPVKPIQQVRNRHENEPYIKLNNKRESARKIAPPSLAEIEDTFKNLIAEKNRKEDPATEAAKFSNYYGARDWRNGSRVKIQSHNLAANCATWLDKYDTPIFNRRPEPQQQEPPKLKKAADILNDPNYN